MRFNQFELEDGTLDAIAAMGYEEATPIQAKCLAPLLSGRDMVGQARTGSGKTAAFGIPMINALRAEHKHVQGLVLVPTRELAIQVTEVLEDLARGSRLRIVSVYGGAGFGAQEKALAGSAAKIVVATPGRLLDHCQRGTLDLGKIRFLVLDEADRMLDMGFVNDMRKVLRMVPNNRQTALFSATVPQEILKLVKEFTSDAVRVHVDGGEATPDAEQYVAQVEKDQKLPSLVRLLHEERPARGVVFTRTKHLAKRLAKRLDTSGWSSVALQGNMTQGQRERAMRRFRDGEARLLVATDVAARGLDVHGITHVINYDLPDPDSYVHRVGRTARNGATGKAFTFVQKDQSKDWRDVEKVAGNGMLFIDIDPDADLEMGPDQPTVEEPRQRNRRPPGPGKNKRPGQGRRPRYQGNAKRQHGAGRKPGNKR